MGSPLEFFGYPLPVADDVDEFEVEVVGVFEVVGEMKGFWSPPCCGFSSPLFCP